jgi:hypothetical protein
MVPMDMNWLINRYEQQLARINYPIPPAFVRRELGNMQYLMYLNRQSRLYEGEANENELFPRFYCALDLNDDDDDVCVFCMNTIEDQDEISCYGCNKHYVHSWCLMKYFQCGGNNILRCPTCRFDGIVMYPDYNVEEIKLEEEEEEEEENEDLNA